ncbi:MAG: hypothetical protein H7124_01870 [Phycisphaerales bacterium]|nr:hypothetical protein [Hyphomonadaceae bacterium]
MGFRALLAACALSLCACATNPANLNITPQSDRGLIVLVALPSPEAYTLDLLRYDEERGRLDANTFGGIHTFMVEPTAAPGYLLQEARPGRYLLTNVGVQGYWAVCFSEQTIAFDLAPGDVVFLGDFNPAPHIRQLHQIARDTGQTATRGGAVHFFDDIEPPRLREPTEEGRAALEAFLRRTAPGVTAPVRSATLEPARFGIGHDIVGQQRICGGYYERPAQ